MVTYNLPDWLKPPKDLQLLDLAEQAQYVIDLSALNVKHGTGGPFGAAVFTHYGRLMAAGVNRVMPENCSMLHAEVMAIMEAERVAGSWDLSGGLRLVTSCQPCCMCFGAILWSGISEMVYCATADDARAIGFDEGPLVPDWIVQYAARGITVIGPVMRAGAAAVLNQYQAGGAVIYNPQNAG